MDPIKNVGHHEPIRVVKASTPIRCVRARVTMDGHKEILSGTIEVKHAVARPHLKYRHVSQNVRCTRDLHLQRSFRESEMRRYAPNLLIALSALASHSDAVPETNQAEATESFSARARFPARVSSLRARRIAKAGIIGRTLRAFIVQFKNAVNQNVPPIHKSRSKELALRSFM